MNRRSFLGSWLAAACIAVAERVMPATLVGPKVVDEEPRASHVADCLDLGFGGLARYMRVRNGVVEWSHGPDFTTIVATQEWRYKVVGDAAVLTPESAQWLAECEAAIKARPHL